MHLSETEQLALTTPMLKIAIRRRSTRQPPSGQVPSAALPAAALLSAEPVSSGWFSYENLDTESQRHGEVNIQYLNKQASSFRGNLYCSWLSESWTLWHPMEDTPDWRIPEDEDRKFRNSESETGETKILISELNCPKLLPTNPTFRIPLSEYSDFQFENSSARHGSSRRTQQRATPSRSNLTRKRISDLLQSTGIERWKST